MQDLAGMLGRAEKRVLLAFLDGKPRDDHEPTDRANRLWRAQQAVRDRVQDDRDTGLSFAERQAVLAWLIAALVAGGDGDEAVGAARSSMEPDQEVAHGTR
jgi:hypothetical protein